MSSEKPLLYVILGATGSGRREVVADLIDGGLAEGDVAASILAADEPADAADGKIGTVSRWSWVRDGDGPRAIDATLPEGASHVFFFVDGRGSPVDQAEALKTWVPACGAELARVICVVNCQLAEKHSELRAWYDACVHFSDVVLLNRRDGVGNKWLSDFQGYFRDQFIPCLFEMVKAGRVKNPAAMLIPEARRMSHIFDIDEWAGIDLTGVEFGSDEGDSEDDESEPTPARKPAGKGKPDPKAKADPKAKTDGKGKPGANGKPPGKTGGKPAPVDDEDDWMPQIDPYFELDAAGRRKKDVPDIRRFL